jgi:hypothetical protein
MSYSFKEYQFVLTPNISKWSNLGFLNGLSGWAMHNTAEALEMTANILLDLDEEGNSVVDELKKYGNKEMVFEFQGSCFNVIRILIAECNMCMTYENLSHRVFNILHDFAINYQQIYHISYDIHQFATGRDFEAEAIDKYCKEFNLF